MYVTQISSHSVMHYNYSLTDYDIYLTAITKFIQVSSQMGQVIGYDHYEEIYLKGIQAKSSVHLMIDPLTNISY